VLFFAVCFVIGCDQKTVSPPGSSQSSSPTESKNSQGESQMAITVTSSAFKAGQPIPKDYTSEGQDRSPPLAWSGVPAAAKELALVCDDPDAPTPEPWVHWVIYKIPAATTELPEGIPREPRLSQPGGALQGANTWESNNTGYRGPEPPRGHGVHHYHFKLYAVDNPLDVKPGLDKKALLAAMQGHIVAQGELIGTYERK
jgi:Raf kinase inhibitor-like YbhB/YbcL family protein